MRKMLRLRAKTLHGQRMHALILISHKHLRTLLKECQWIRKLMHIHRMNLEALVVWHCMQRNKLWQRQAMIVAGKFGTLRTRRIS